MRRGGTQTAIDADLRGGRRRFLRRCLQLGLLLGLMPRRAAAGLTGGAPGRRAAGAPGLRLLEVFRRPQSARVAGAAYLAQHPGEADAERLAARLAHDLGGKAAVAAARGRRGLQRLVERRTRRDFAAGRIVRVHGWMLAETEVRLCALAALVGEDA